MRTLGLARGNPLRLDHVRVALGLQYRRQAHVGRKRRENLFLSEHGRMPGVGTRSHDRSYHRASLQQKQPIVAYNNFAAPALGREWAFLTWLRTACRVKGGRTGFSIGAGRDEILYEKHLSSRIHHFGCGGTGTRRESGSNQDTGHQMRDVPQ